MLRNLLLIVAALLVTSSLSGCASQFDSPSATDDDLRRCPSTTPSDPAPAPAPTPDSPAPVEADMATAPTTPTTPGSPLFASGWDQTAGLGCNLSALLDGSWDDYGGSGACNGGVHDADVVSDVVADGTQSLRITQKPCPLGAGNCAADYNGTDFREVKMFGDRPEVTLVWKVRYDAATYRWAGADHKNVIFTDAAQTAQTVYINYRGGSDAQHGRVVIGLTIPDTVFADNTHQVTVGRWYRFRTHVVAGAHGTVEVWLTDCGTLGSDAACAVAPEVKLSFVLDAGVAANLSDVATGTIGAFKLDTTYNAGNTISQLMYTWYDSFRLYDGLYLGQ